MLAFKVNPSENGYIYEYIPESAAASDLVPALKDGGNFVSMALGGGEVVASGAALAVLAFNPLIAAAGLGAAAAAGGGGGGGGTTAPVKLAPAAPVIAESTNGGINFLEASNGTPIEVSLAGTNAVAGDVINVIIDGQSTPYTLLASDIVAGVATVTVPKSVLVAAGQGEAILTATISGNAGNTSSASPATTFNIDTLAPDVPTIGDLADDVGSFTGSIAVGAVTDDTRPTLSGTAPADAKSVNIYDDINLVGSATVGLGGAWSFTPVAAIGSGPKAWSAIAVDAAGNQSGKTSTRDFTLVGAAPAAPAITQVFDDLAPQTGALQKGDFTNDTTLVISGSGTVGTTVNIYSNGALVGNTTVKADGSWSGPTTNLGVDGLKEITAQAVDAAGQPSSITGAYGINLDTTAPFAGTKPPQQVISDDQGDGKGTITAGGTTDDTQPTFSGAGQVPGNLVTVKDGIAIVGTVTVQADGTWSLTPTTPLGQGAHSTSYTVTDPAGNTSPASDAVSFTLDSSAVVVTISKISDNVLAYTDDITNDGLTNDTTPTLVGTATAGSVVTIKDGSTTLGTVTANAVGAWSFTTPVQAGGAHTYTATANNAASTTGTASFKVTIDSAAPDRPSLSTLTVVDDVGTQQDKLKSGDTTDDTTPTLNGSGATPGQLISVYDSDKPVGTATVGADGKWTLTIPAPGLTNGTHSLTYSATDAAGNESFKSDPFIMTVDTLAPNAGVAPTVTLTTDSNNDGTVSSNELGTSTMIAVKAAFDKTKVVAGDKVNFSDGTISNTTTVVLTTDDITNGFATASFAKPSEGSTFAVTAKISDTAGNETDTGTDSAKVDTTPPSPATTTHTIDAITGDDFLSVAEQGGNVTITGSVTGEYKAGDKVTITVDNSDYFGTVDAAGKYSVSGVPGSKLVADFNTGDKAVSATILASDSINNMATITATPRSFTLGTNPEATKTALTLDPVAGDNVVTLAEAGNTTTTLTGKATGSFGVGDIVTLTLGLAGRLKTYTTTVNAAGAYTVTLDTVDLKADTDTKVEVRIDATMPGSATKQTAIASQDYVVETGSSAGKLTAISLDPVTADNFISSAENTGNIAIAGKVTGKFATGDTVTLMVKGAAVTGNVNAQGGFSINVPAADLVADTDTQIEARVTGTGGTAASALQNYAVVLNTAPINNAPSAQSVAEDIALAFTGANAISVADNDGNLATTQLSVARGTLSLTASGATISAGANNSATLTLSGTQAHINAALATVQYKGVLNYNGADELSIVSTDSQGAQDTDKVAITVTPINDAPVLTPSTTVRSYNENATAILANNDLSLTDADSANLTGAAVQITGGRTTGDVLNFTASNGITGSYNSATGTLTLTGSATVAQYQTALRSVSYSSTSDHPTATSASRTLTWQANDEAGVNNLSASATSTINVTPVNDAPTGAVTISGTARVGQKLTATNNVADVDGLGTLSYSWYATANGITTAISGATSSTYTLVSGDFGKNISARVNYTDGGGKAEQVTSSATTAVSAVPLNPETLAFASDTGSSNTDKITNNGLINVTLSQSGNAWEYSTNSGTTWQTGTGTSFTLPAATYAANQVRVRETSIDGSNLVTNYASGATVDTSGPTVAVTLPSGTVTGARTVTFTFSEAVAEFSNADVSVANGTLSTVTTSNNVVWTATYSPTLAVSSASNAISVGSNSYTDVAGNNGAAGQATFAVNTSVSSLTQSTHGANAYATFVANTYTSFSLGYSYNPIFVGGVVTAYNHKSNTDISTAVAIGSRTITANDTGTWLIYSGEKPLVEQYGNNFAKIEYNGVTYNLPQMVRVLQATAVVTYQSPLVLDLNGDGVQTVDTSSGVVFDVLGSGSKRVISWVDRHDGFLSIDLNGDGQINNGTELFGSGTLMAARPLMVGKP